MIDKITLAQLTQQMIDLAKQRNTQQGLKTYEAMIQRLNTLDSEQELTELLELFKRNLVGIEAHGHFSQEELEVVGKIREIK